MKLHSIRLENFRMYENKEIHFDPQFNVIIGDNGTGKTTILEAITVALNPYLKLIMGRNVRPLRREDIRYHLQEAGKIQDLFCSVHAKASHENRMIEWTSVRTRTNWGFMRNDDADFVYTSRVLVEKASEDAKSYLPIIKYYGSVRFQRDKAFTVKKSFEEFPRLNAYNQAYNRLSSLTSFVKWFQGMDATAEDGNVLAREKAQYIRNAILRCVPGWSGLSYDPKLDELMGLRKNPKSGEQESLPFSYLSDGQKTMMSLVADLAFRCFTLNPYYDIERKDATKETEGIVMIDEIDVHLHPNWQREVVQMLKDVFPKIQFIVTTHSPFIVQSLSDNELINLNDKYSESGYENKDLEWISRTIMDVDNPARSSEYNSRKELASKYLVALQKYKDRKSLSDSKFLLTEFRKIEDELKEYVQSKSINPAYAAFLELKKDKLIDL